MAVDQGRAFSISTPSASVMLPPNRTAEVPFTVTNLSGRPLRARAVPRGLGDAPADWFKIVGDAEMEYDDGAVKQVRVVVDPALGAPAKSYPFRLDVEGVQNPAQEFTEGPECAVEVPGSTTRLTIPRGYLATLTGASAGGVVWLIAVLVMWLVVSDRADSECSDFGDCIGEIIGLVILFALLVIAGLAAMIVSGAIGVGIALRIKHYRGNKLTALFFGVLMVPWVVLASIVLNALDVSNVVILILAPLVLLAMPALLARALVLLIRTHHI